MQKLLPKSKLSDFLNVLMKKHEVFAPIKHGFKFEKINSSKDLSLDKLTKISAKYLFLPENEVILEFKNKKPIEPKIEIKPRIIFGLRKCDLNALKVLDKIMFDTHYILRRKNTILIGLFCENPDQYCFCNSMRLEDYHDLFFYPEQHHYRIFIGSKKGEELVKNLPSARHEIALPNPKNTRELKHKDIERNYKNSIWESDVQKCLSCSACTSYCPTCACFDIKDNIDINFQQGTRTRHLTSCHLKSFSRVAGGKSYRDSRLARFKHYVYHKIIYYQKQHGRPMCVGCGRCTRACPARINWVDTINLLKDVQHSQENEAKQ